MKIIFAMLILVLTASHGKAQSNLRISHCNLENSVAIQGYDPVAYFTQKKALEGNKKITASAEGIIYYFSSVVNRDLFLKDYKKYEPQYGGWCAYAMGANNEKVEIDPKTFKIIDGKLYLFYHTWVNNTLLKWNENESVLKQNADKNWQKIFH